MGKDNLNPKNENLEKFSKAGTDAFIDKSLEIPCSIRTLKALKLSTLTGESGEFAVDDNPDKLLNILLVEDNLIDATIHLKMLNDQKSFKVTHVSNINSAFDSIIKGEYELILLDLSLPDEEGFETFIRLSEHAPEIPIIVLTGFNNEELAMKIMKHGAQDYLLKGHVNRDLLTRSIRYAIERYKLLERIYNLSLIDELTGLYNRRAFQIIGERYLKLAKRNNYNMLMFFIDLDSMKKINDNYGHLEGDLAIKNTAGILKKTFRDSDLVARMGGDEFIALMFIGDLDSSFNAISARLKESIADFNSIKENFYDLSVSVGGVFCRVNKDTYLEEMINKADNALYEHKKMKHDRDRGFINLFKF